MAQEVKPYGLVYNDDGTLCTSIRDDTVPFTGVKSFAVEKSSTNILPANAIIFSNWTAENIDTQIVNSKYEQFIIPFTLDAGTLYVPKLELTTTGITGEHTVSIHVQSYKEVQLSVGSTVPNDTYKDTSYTGQLSVTKTFVEGDKVAITLPASYPGTIFNIKNPQIEAGSIATSYVEPCFTRPAGKFKLEATDTASKGITYNNYVISFWAYFKSSAIKHIAGNTDSIAMIFSDTDTDTHNGIRFFINSAGTLTTGTYGASASTTDTTRMPAKGWHNIVLVSDTAGVKSYIDGGLVSSLSANLPAILNNFYVGCSYDTTQTFNSLISNLYIGLYKKPDGTIIWTDNYIQRIYTAKRPFVIDQPALYTI